MNNTQSHTPSENTATRPFEQEGTTSTAAGERLKAVIAEAIREALTEIKVYVLESEITSAQQAVKAVVEQATF